MESRERSKTQYIDHDEHDTSRESSRNKKRGNRTKTNKTYDTKDIQPEFYQPQCVKLEWHSPNDEEYETDPLIIEQTRKLRHEIQKRQNLRKIEA